jgi:hypothetical protein
MASTIRLLGLTSSAVLLVGLAAGVAIGSSVAPPVALSAASAAPGQPVDAALPTDLDALLAADQTAASAAAATPKDHINAAVNGLRRLAAARRLVHATVVVDLPKLGGLTTIQLDHGTISAVGATSLSVTEAGGSTVTVSLGDDTRVRRNAAKAGIGDLKSGDEVFVMSRIESGGTVAYLVVAPTV